MELVFKILFGLVVGIISYLIWKKLFKRFLPHEDAFIIKLFFSIGYLSVGMLDGILLTSTNVLLNFVGFVFLFFLFVISYFFGIYYKIKNKKT